MRRTFQIIYVQPDVGYNNSTIPVTSLAGFDYRDWSIATIFSGPTTAAELPCFVLPVASLPGGVQPRCLSIVSQARFFFFFLLALFGLPLQRTWYLLFVRV